MKTKEYWSGIIVDPGDEYVSFEAIVDAIQKDAFESGRVSGINESIGYLGPMALGLENLLHHDATKK